MALVLRSAGDRRLRRCGGDDAVPFIISTRDARPDLMLRRETPPSPEEFAQMLRENDSLAAETDGRLAGFLLWQPRAYPEDLEEGRRAYDAFALIDLYTAAPNFAAAAWRRRCFPKCARGQKRPARRFWN